MRENVDYPPPDTGPRRGGDGGRPAPLARRRTGVVGGAALFTAGVVALAAVVCRRGVRPRRWPRGDRCRRRPTISFGDAAGRRGRDLRELTTHTDEQPRPGRPAVPRRRHRRRAGAVPRRPRADRLRPRFALLDPATGERDWLPDPRLGQVQTWPVELSADRLVLTSTSSGPDGTGRLRRPRPRPFDAGVERRSPGRRCPPSTPFARPDRTRRPALRVGAEHPGPAAPGRVADDEGGEAEDADAEGDTFR